MFHRLLLLAFALTSSTLVLADEARPVPVSLPVDADRADDVQNLLYLGRDRPVFVRLHLRVEGQSFRANWRRFAERMFGEFDQNADGLLSENEWGRIPSIDFLVLGNTLGAPQGIDSVREAIDRSPTDGLVTLEEFADYLLRRGSRAISVLSMGNGEGQGRPQVQATNDGAGNRLFYRLDTDGDGRLTSDELTAGSKFVTAADFDEDGAMSVAELMNAPSSISRQNGVASQTSSRPSQFVDIPDAGPLDALCRRLMDRYDDPDENVNNRGGTVGDDRLSPKELQLPADVFKDLDVDADGFLSFEELPGIVRHCRPSLVITARIGARQESEPQIDVARLDPELAAEIQILDKGRVMVYTGGDHLDFNVDPSADGSRVRESLLKMFKAADRDNNSYLERSEIARTIFAVSFDSMDEDGDGRLFEAEFSAWLARREAAAESRCQMSVANEGRNLFDNLDANRDGRITPRELRNAPSQTRAWDRDADSKLSLDEIPAHYRIVFGRAQPEIAGLPAFGNGPPPQRGGPERQGPGWFHRMDRNHDGEITRREFLGTKAKFEHYDRNHDGVIEPGEASSE
jgi:Ca2+-binding EF-hand superfamily protein